jgi:hypothetical protein
MFFNRLPCSMRASNIASPLVLIYLWHFQWNDLGPLSEALQWEVFQSLQSFTGKSQT